MVVIDKMNGKAMVITVKQSKVVNDTATNPVSGDFIFAAGKGPIVQLNGTEYRVEATAPMVIGLEQIN